MKNEHASHAARCRNAYNAVRLQLSSLRLREVSDHLHIEQLFDENELEFARMHIEQRRNAMDREQRALLDVENFIVLIKGKMANE